MNEEIEKLLGGYATDSLDEEQRQRLFAAALEDQEVFDALMNEEPLRELLGNPLARAEILRSLRRRSATQRAARWVGAHGGLAMAAGVAFVAVAGFLVIQRLRPIQPSPGVPSPAATGGWNAPLLIGRPNERRNLGQRLMGLPLAATTAASLRLNHAGDSPEYAAGDPWRAFFHVAHDSNVVLIEQHGDGTIVQLYPNAAAPFPRMKAGDHSLPAAGQPDRVIEPPSGPRVVRLFLFPLDVDPLTLTRDTLEAVEVDVEIAEARYVVR